MKYVNIVIPKQDKKYNAELLKNLLPQNVRGQIITLDEYKSQREGNTNDDIAIFIGKDPGNLSHGKCLYPKEEEWGADVTSINGHLSNYIGNQVTITSVGRSALIKCYSSGCSQISNVVAKAIIEKMDAVFNDVGLSVDVRERTGLMALWGSYGMIFGNYIVEAKKVANGEVGRLNRAKLWKLTKNAAKEAWCVTIPVEYFYEYAVCIFVRDYLEDFLKDSRDVFEDNTPASELTGAEREEKKN